MSEMEGLIVMAALAVAFTNGANDNFKGFATVWGSDTLDYRRALVLATAATAAESFASLSLAESLVQHFSGHGFVPDAVADTPPFLASAASSAGLTVFSRRHCQRGSRRRHAGLESLGQHRVVMDRNAAIGDGGGVGDRTTPVTRGGINPYPFSGLYRH